MKFTPLHRRAPLRATGRLKRRKDMAARKPKRLSKRTPEASAYMAFVRTLSCIVCGRVPVDASHVSLGPNDKGIGMKVSDFQVVPHCRKCHQEWEERRGFCRGWSKEMRWATAERWVADVTWRAALATIATRHKEP